MTVLDVKIGKAGYNKTQTAIQSIALNVQAGELVGLIGANGAGKSTTIKTLLDLIP